MVTGGKVACCDTSIKMLLRTISGLVAELCLMRVGKSGPRWFSLSSAITLVMLFPTWLSSGCLSVLCLAFRSPGRYTGTCSLNSFSMSQNGRNGLRGGKLPAPSTMGPLFVFILGKNPWLKSSMIWCYVNNWWRSVVRRVNC